MTRDNKIDPTPPDAHSESIARGIAFQFSVRDFQIMDAGRIHELLIDKIAAALREYGSKCPECEVKSLAQYQDKYGINETEWTKEQMIKAMWMIYYDRMDLLHQIKEADAEGYRRGVEEKRIHTIFEFARSRGWEPMINGLWARVDGHRMSNCIPIDEVLKVIYREDVPSVDYNQQRGTGDGVR